LVERGPEKAGVGGSIPSLATILFQSVLFIPSTTDVSKGTAFVRPTRGLAERELRDQLVRTIDGDAPQKYAPRA
jgi:hypothetical protein